MLDQQALLALAERVANTASAHGVESALIGAAAMAVYGRVRGTKDIDFASAVNPYEKLREVERALVEQGLRARLNLPDDSDSLGGVLRVWTADFEDEDGDPTAYVEIVNFMNPHRVRRTPARDAIARARSIDGLRTVTLPDLIAFKLYGGSRQDLADIVELLVQNPDQDLDEVRTIASPFDETNVLEQLIAEARAR